MSYIDPKAENFALEKIEKAFQENDVKLELTGLRLGAIPREIGKLKSLKTLRLGPESRYPEDESIDTQHKYYNYIKEIPEELCKLSNLETLDLEGNEIASLPPTFKNLTGLKHLNLRENLLPIPPEILEKRDNPQSIIDYYFSFTDARKKPLNETKLIIVGQGSVGKTSLVKRLVSNKFDPLESKTSGIAIEKWKIPARKSDSFLEDRKNKIYDKLSLIQFNIWDFGGQEIMHATHQFFLTKRSIYLLVLDSRLTQEENRVEYWLKLIQSFGGDSPVIIVGNKRDQHLLDIDQTGLMKKYRNIVGIVRTSAANGDGIFDLKDAIIKQVQKMPYVRDLLPETWFEIKEHLEKLGYEKNYILYEEYKQVCNQIGVTEVSNQNTLIDFLHDLGIILYFQDEPRLKDLGILSPQWVTNGVYRILNSYDLYSQKGKLTIKTLDKILELENYPPSKRMFIIDMMRKFELCYDIESDKTFLVPDLLPKDQPNLKFNGVPAFEYAYPVLPSSVITRFIVRMNQKIDDGLVWRTGVVLKIGENKALVKADSEDRKITIAIDGLEHTRRDALSAIRYELGEIHNSIKGLNPQQRVPVPNAPLAEPLKYEYLLKLERAGQETVLVENGNDLVTVNVRQMLSAIETEAQRRENAPGSFTTNYFISGDVNASGDFVGRDKSISAGDSSVIAGQDISGNVILGDNNKIIQDSYNKIKSAEIDPELKQTLKLLTEAITTVVQSFPEEKTAKVVKNFERLADEVTQPEPDKQWYSVSIEGLIKAAENLDKLGAPVINLSRKVLSLLTGGVVK